jgi:hypothetical protein
MRSDRKPRVVPPFNERYRFPDTGKDEWVVNKVRPPSMRTGSQVMKTFRFPTELEAQAYYEAHRLPDTTCPTGTTEQNGRCIAKVSGKTYGVAPGRTITLNDKQLFYIKPEEGFSPTKADAMTHYIADLLNKDHRNFDRIYERYMGESR